MGRGLTGVALVAGLLGAGVAMADAGPLAPNPPTAQSRYEQLAALEATRAGDADFDYALGVSALDTGRVGEAIYALQRALLVRPTFPGARMELARAYFALGDNEAARREFLALQDQEPPPEAARAIAGYLEAIDRRAAPYRAQGRVTLELGGGYDSNANGAPQTQTFLGFALDARNQATDSTYYGAGLGAAWSQPLWPRWRTLGEARLHHRAYGEAQFVDSDSVAVATGLEWRKESWSVGLTPAVAWAWLGGEDNHRIAGADLGIVFDEGPARLAATARYSMLRYAEALVLDLQEVDTVLVGVTSTLLWPGASTLGLTAAMTAGQDEPLSALSPFGRELFGERITLHADVGRGLVLFLSGGRLQSDYDGLFFGQPRTDEQWAGALGADWRLPRLRGWSLRAQLGYLDNTSTVSLYDYDRSEAGLNVRREFK